MTIFGLCTAVQVQIYQPVGAWSYERPGISQLQGPAAQLIFGSKKPPGRADK